MRLIGVDIGGTTIKLGLFDEKGTPITLREYDTEGHLGGRKVLENLIGHIGEIDDFDAIGISSAGQIDPKNGIIVEAVNIPGTSGLEVKRILEDEFHVPVTLENDVNAAALGEKYFGVGQDDPDFLFLAYGTGIGGAIIYNSELYYGKKAFAGEFGHMVTHGNGRKCNCGMRGCYETYASTTALVREAEKLNPAYKNGRILFEQWHAGDEQVKEIIANWVEEIAIGLVSLVHGFNPSTIIIGGGIMEQEVLIDMIQKRVDEQIIPVYKEVKLIKASLGNKSGMLGAISRHLKR